MDYTALSPKPASWQSSGLQHPSRSLEPFKDSNRTFYTSNAITDITKLGYTYGSGSFHMQKSPRGLPTPVPGTEEYLFALVRVTQTNRAGYEGFSVTRTYAMINGKMVETDRGANLSRCNVNNCKNCQSHFEADSYAPIHGSLRSTIGLKKETDVENNMILDSISKRHRVDEKGKIRFCYAHVIIGCVGSCIFIVLLQSIGCLAQPHQFPFPFPPGPLMI